MLKETKGHTTRHVTGKISTHQLKLFYQKLRYAYFHELFYSDIFADDATIHVNNKVLKH